MSRPARCTCSDPTHFHPGEEAGHWLFPLIDQNKCSALNEVRANSVREVFRPYEQRLDENANGPLEAEDGELIVIVPFTETVRIKSFQIIPANYETAVRNIRLFINRDDVDFDNVRDLKTTQEVTNVPVDLDGVIDNPLIASRFSAVDKLIMHIMGATDALVQVLSIGFKGESRGLNKKVLEGIKYEIRAQLKDHTSTRADNSGLNDIL